MSATARFLGYARVSTEEQATDAQTDELRRAGCRTIYEEHASGASRARPELARLLKDIRPGDILVVARLDRLARSVSHLLEVIEGLTARGAHFRSLRDPIDTSTPQGMFSLQVLGAVAQLERALISERTKAGVAAAKARGRMPGNPGLRNGDPAAIRKTAAAREKVYIDEVIAGMDAWSKIVKQMRPYSPWDDVVRVLNHQTGSAWTVERLRRATRLAVKEKLLPANLLDKAPRSRPDDRLSMIIVGIKIANPALTIREIASQLEKMRERTPRGGVKWSPSSVQHLLEQAKKYGLAPPALE